MQATITPDGKLIATALNNPAYRTAFAITSRDIQDTLFSSKVTSEVFGDLESNCSSKEKEEILLMSVKGRRREW